MKAEMIAQEIIIDKNLFRFLEIAGVHFDMAIAPVIKSAKGEKCFLIGERSVIIHTNIITIAVITGKLLLGGINTIWGMIEKKNCWKKSRSLSLNEKCYP